MHWASGPYSGTGRIRTYMFSQWHLIYSQAPSPFGYVAIRGKQRTRPPTGYPIPCFQDKSPLHCSCFTFHLRKPRGSNSNRLSPDHLSRMTWQTIIHLISIKRIPHFTVSLICPEGFFGPCPLLRLDQRSRLLLDSCSWQDLNLQRLPLGYKILSLMRFNQFRHRSNGTQRGIRTLTTLILSQVTLPICPSRYKKRVSHCWETLFLFIFKSSYAYIVSPSVLRLK